MKKFLLSLLSVIIASVAASAVEYTATFTSGKADTSNAAIMTYQASYGTGVEAPDFVFTAEKSSSGNNNPVFNSYPRVYANSTFTVSVPEGVTVTKLAFDDKKTDRTGELTANTGTVTYASSTYTWTGSVTGGDIVLTVPAKSTWATTKTNAAQFFFSKVVITAEGSAAPAKKNAGLAFASDAASGLVGQADFVAPALANPNGLAVTYTSSNPAVATVNNGSYELLSAGTTIITATSEETEEFKAGEATFTLTVIKPGNPADGVVATITGGSAGNPNTIYNYTVAYNAANVPAFTFQAEKGSDGSTNPTFNNYARVYANSTFTISVPEGYTVTKLVFDEQNEKRTAQLTANEGTVTWDATGKTQTWEGSVTGGNIVITVPNNVTFGTDGPDKVAQFCFSQITITYEEAVQSGKEPAGLAFAENVLNLKTTDFFAFPVLNNPNELPVTYTSSNPEVIEVVDNGAEYGDFRWNFAVKGAGECVITATSEETDVYDAGKATITIKVAGVASNISEMFKYAPNAKDKVQMTGSLTVVAAGQSGNNSYIYVTDNQDNATLLYGSNLSYEKGDIIPGGWEAEYSPYNGLPEWKGSFPAATSSFPELVSYATVDKVTEADINKVVVVSGVVLDEDTNLNGKNGSINAKFADGSAIVIRNTFLLDDVKAGTYDVLAAVAIYNGTLQLYPFEYNEPAGEPVYPAEGLTFTSEDGEIVSYIDEEEGAQIVVATLETEKDFAVVKVEIPETFNKIYYTSLDGMYMSLNKAPRKAHQYTEGWSTVDQLIESGLIGLTEGTQIEVPADGEEHGYYVFAGINDRIFYSRVSLTVTAKKVVEPIYPEEGLKFSTEEGELYSEMLEDEGYQSVIAILETYNEYAVINVEVPETFDAIYYMQADEMIGGFSKAPRKAHKFTEGWPTYEEMLEEGYIGLTKGTEIKVPADGETHAYVVYAGLEGKVYPRYSVLEAVATEIEPVIPAEGINFTSQHGALYSYIVDGQQMVAGELETTDEYAVIDIELPIGFNSAHHFDAHYDIDIDDPNVDDAPAYAPKKATRFEGWQTAEEMGVELTNDVQIQVPNDGKQHNYYVFLGKNGYIHQTPALVQVKVYNRPTGVDGVEAAEEAEYYTLQGVKVSNPEKGFYIKVLNGKATRVFVK